MNKTVPLQTLPEEEVLALLDGQECILQELYRAVDELFDRLRCPHCGSRVEKIVDARRPFTDAEILPRFLARCASCGCIFTQEGIIIKTGGLPTEVPNPDAGMSSVDPRNHVIAPRMIEQYLRATGAKRGPLHG